jgi:hypothetical protein
MANCLEKLDNALVSKRFHVLVNLEMMLPDQTIDQR